MPERRENAEQQHQQLVLKIANEAGRLMRQEGKSIPQAIVVVLDRQDIKRELVRSRDETLRQVASVLGQRGQRGRQASRELSAWRQEESNPERDAQKALDEEAARAGFASGEELDEFLRK